MRRTSSAALALALLALLPLWACNSPTGSTAGGGSSATTVATATPASITTPQDGGRWGMGQGPLRCAPTPGMLGACGGKATGDACTLSGTGDGGWSLPGSCRSTLDGTGLACVPAPPGPPTFLVAACSGKTQGASCSASGPRGHSFEGTCTPGPSSGPLFCGRAHTPPAAVTEACSGKADGDSCSRPETRDGGTKAGVCRTGPAGALACRPAESWGTSACTGLDAGATCTLGFGHSHTADGEGPTGSCVVPVSGGAATCVVSCAELFHRFHHHRHGFGGRGGGTGGPWWKHGAKDGGVPAP